MIIVTGAAGFIGSNIIKQLNQRGEKNILAVDHLTDGKRFKNLADLDIADYLDKDDFLNLINQRNWQTKIDVIFHQGACSDTTEWDGHFMMKNNYEYSKTLLHFCLTHHVPFIYASSAAVYGNHTTFVEKREYEKPLNVYGYSKMLFDHYVRPYFKSAKSQIVGLRYFNVYGPREDHKGKMASVAFHLHHQLLANGVIKLFAGCDGYADGEQKRDFIYIDDVVSVNLWFWKNNQASGIFNVGTGNAQPFNDIAQAVLQWHGKGRLEYIPFPEHLVGHYQSFTEANITALRSVGYTKSFKRVADGVKHYLDELQQNPA